MYNVFYVYKNDRDLQLSKKSVEIAFREMGVDRIDVNQNSIVVDIDNVYSFVLLQNLEYRLIGRRINKIKFFNIDDFDISEPMMDFIKSRIIRE